MATVAGSLARTAFRRPLTSSSVQNAARAGNRPVLPRGHRPAFQHRHQHQRQHQSRRGYSTAPPAGEKSSWSTRLPYWGLGLTVAGGAAYYFSTVYQGQSAPESLKKGSAPDAKKGGVFKPTRDDYQRVYDEVARRLDENDEYDDGSFGPVIVRLAWHCSGTYVQLTTFARMRGPSADEWRQVRQGDRHRRVRRSDDEIRPGERPQRQFRTEGGA